MFLVALLILATGVLVYLCKDSTTYYVGYRTYNSMINQKNWHFAQVYSGIRFIILGFILLGIATVEMLMNWNQELLKTLFGITVFGGILLILLVTEIALGKLKP